MPFANTDSITATNLNNMRRGLYRDNTDRSVTGTTSETDLASVSIAGGTITATGRVVVEAAGTITGSGGTKRIRMYFGATAIIDTTAATGTADWWLRAVISNTATGAQRCHVVWHDHQNTTNFNFDYITAAIDTTAAVTLKVTGTLAAGADTITQTVFAVEVEQIS